MTSCNNADGKEAVEPPLTSGVLLANMDSLVDPGDNFTAYVNGSWVKNNEIPNDKGHYGVGYMVHEQAERDVRQIIEESSEGDFAEGSSEQKLGDLYSSFMDVEKRNAIGYSPLQGDIQKIESITSYDELAEYFAYASTVQVTSPLSYFIEPDFKDPDAYALYIFQSGLGLPEREYYLSKDSRSREIRAKYLEHIEKVFTLVNFPEGKASAEEILALETKIAEGHMKKEETRNIAGLYNPFPVDSLDEVMPQFNWELYLKGIGAETQDRLVIATLDYARHLDGLITATPLDTWKTYLKWTLVNSNASNLTEALDNQDFDFYSKELSSIEEQRPLWTRGVGIVNSNLGEVVGEVYVRKHFPAQAKARMQEMVDNLIKAYEVSIRELDWMGEETRKEALDKLSKFDPKIGYPDKWKDYSGLKIAAEDYYGNLRRSALFAHAYEMNKLGKPINREEWGMTPQTVNAYYNPTKNEIVFPAAILQPPFFDLKAEDAVNYGAIGAVIGHEIGHGFDDAGSTFDGDGKLRNWWTEKDREEFKKRTGKLVEQYDGYEVVDSVFVNGEFTLGENIGDLGGLSIALKAYKLSLKGEEAPVMDGFTGEQRVFIGYGQAWMEKAREESLRMQVNTDPHSPAEFRVNGVVRNIPEFYEAFNVTPDDELYLAPEERVKIW